MVLAKLDELAQRIHHSYTIQAYLSPRCHSGTMHLSQVPPT